MFRALADSVWRDHVTAGVPASGVHEPEKAAIRELFGVIDNQFDAVVAALVAGGAVAAATQAALFGDLAHDADTVALVTSDADPSNNGAYIKVGASGAGSWSQLWTGNPWTASESMLDQIEAYRDETQGYAEDAAELVEGAVSLDGLPALAAISSRGAANFAVTDLDGGGGPGRATYRMSDAALFGYCRARGKVLRPGKFISLSAEAGSATTMVAGTIYLRPLPVLKGGAINLARLRVTTGVAAAVVSAALYAQADAFDATLTLVGELYDFDAASAGLKNSAGALGVPTLDDQTLYWAAVATDATGVGVQMLTAEHELIPGDGSLSTTLAAMTDTGFDGTWPATIDLAAAGTATRMPNLALQAA